MKLSLFPIYLLLFFFSNKTLSQKDNNKKFEQIKDLQNSSLCYGNLFIERYAKITKSHNYFKSRDYLKADIFYRGELFENIDTKYDLTNDDIIIKINSTINNKPLIIILEQKLITEVTINKKKLVNNKKLGLVEHIFESDKLSILKKYKKKPIKKLNKKFINYTFTEEQIYYINYKSQNTDIRNKNTFIKLFPEHNKFIKKFFKQHRKLKISSTDLFYKKLTSNLIKLIN